MASSDFNINVNLPNSLLNLIDIPIEDDPTMLPNLNEFQSKWKNMNHNGLELWHLTQMLMNYWE